MYTLMNKDKVVVYFFPNPDIRGTYKLEMCVGNLPLGFIGMTDWLIKRQEARHRKYIKKLMVACGCDTLDEFIKRSHCTGINDTFWVKAAEDSVMWKDVSLYRNELDEKLAQCSYEEAGEFEGEFAGLTAEFTLGGSYPKCCKSVNGELCIVKRGTSRYANSGMEPYEEYFTSPIYNALVTQSVQYKLITRWESVATQCSLFTNEKYGYIPYGRVAKSASPKAMLEYYESIGYGDMFRDMIVADAVCFNQDRHGGNHGILVDNDTLEVIGMAPVFDHNVTLLPYAIHSDLSDIDTYLKNMCPRIGDYWVPMARAMLRKETRVKLINLKGYEIP